MAWRRRVEQKPDPTPRWVLLRFALGTMAALGVIGFVINSLTTQQAVTRSESEVAYDAQHTANTVAVRNLQPADFQRRVQGPALQRLDRFMHEFILSDPLLRVKLYSPSGLVTYSNDHSLIGTHSDDPAENARVIHGQVVKDVSQLNAEGGGGSDKKVLEVYVPVHFPGPHGGQRGVLELYSDYGPVQQRINEQRLPILISLAIALPFMFLVLFPLLLQVTRLLRERTKHLDQRTEELRQAQKMDAVGRLAGGIAHDFNNLLTVIRGYVSLLLDEAQEDDPHRADLIEIDKAADKASALTGQLLTFSRRQRADYRILDVREVVEDSRQLVERLLGESIDVEITLPAAPLYAHADAGQLGQVLMNLAVNARDAMEDGGKLTLNAGTVQWSEPHGTAEAGEYVSLTVSDTGHGMDAETKARVFEPFYTTKEAGKGTGLGLSIVYGIVTGAGGTIEVDSVPGAGTSFSIYLPLCDAASPATESHEPKEHVVRDLRATVMVVEDEAPVRKLLVAALEKNGYLVLEATDGQRALEIEEIYDAPVHLLLTDVIMPNLGGPELAKRWMELRNETRVIYMSGYVGQDYQLGDGTLADSDCFLQKPFEMANLLQKVREAIERGVREPAPVVE